MRAQLPAADLIEAGARDLAERKETIAALLVSIGSVRLTRAGLSIPHPIDNAERRLYERLASEDPDTAHGRYNALIRKLESFERALECAS
jgi:hypothetical protein